MEGRDPEERGRDKKRREGEIRREERERVERHNLRSKGVAGVFSSLSGLQRRADQRAVGPWPERERER
jgi:hypothetical protein